VGAFEEGAWKSALRNTGQILIACFCWALKIISGSVGAVHNVRSLVSDEAKFDFTAIRQHSLSHYVGGVFLIGFEDVDRVVVGPLSFSFSGELAVPVIAGKSVVLTNKCVL
jgi:hypothetical protein